MFCINVPCFFLCMRAISSSDRVHHAYNDLLRITAELWLILFTDGWRNNFTCAISPSDSASH